MKETISPREVQHKLMSVNRLHRATLNAKISETGIHGSQHMTLMYLNRCRDKISQKDIAEHFEISPAAVAVSLKKLEAGGYIVRKTSDNDSRYNEIEITEKGKEIVDFSHSIFEDIDNKTFKGMSEEEKQTLVLLLDKVTNNLKSINDKEKE